MTYRDALEDAVRAYNGANGANAHKIPHTYLRPAVEPPRLLCLKCQRRHAPDVQTFDDLWCSLLYCDPCANAAERLDNAERAEVGEAKRRDDLRRRMGAAGLSPVEIDSPFKLDPRFLGLRHPLRTGEHLADIDAWARYVYGPSGTGKSTQAALAVREYVALGWRCRFATVDEIIDDCKPEGVAADSLAYFDRFDLLVIDDLGRETLTPWATGKIVELLDRRLSERHRRPTVITSNLTPNDLRSPPWGARIQERVLRACGPEGLILYTDQHRRRAIEAAR